MISDDNHCNQSSGHHHFSPESVIKKPNQIGHVSTEGDVIPDRTRFRGSEYLVWLVNTQWIGSTSLDRSAIWLSNLWNSISKLPPQSMVNLIQDDSRNNQLKSAVFKTLTFQKKLKASPFIFPKLWAVSQSFLSVQFQFKLPLSF